MLAVNTTVVAVVAAPGAADPLRQARAGNVRVVQPDSDLPDLDRAKAVWELAHRTTAPYLVHDADPLAGVAEAWTAQWDGQGVAGDLEIATAEVLARWRARSLDLPDYYLVVDPDSLPATRQHWYFGVLAGRAPSRVVAGPPAGGVVDGLPGLQSGPWWPPLDRLLAGIDRVVPDRAGPLAGQSAPEAPGLVVPSGRPTPP
ncbi:MAG TPA: hypothetical protein VKV06_05355 [Acidimicrobiales bacterium]|nr:hypothetical protein [Acidimicrobiales bacterium]